MPVILPLVILHLGIARADDAIRAQPVEGVDLAGVPTAASPVVVATFEQGRAHYQVACSAPGCVLQVRGERKTVTLDMRSSASTGETRFTTATGLPPAVPRGAEIAVAIVLDPWGQYGGAE